MSDTTDLTPALTGEEWSRVLMPDTARGVPDDGDTPEHVRRAAQSGLTHAADFADYPKAIALAMFLLPDGDPRKLTWEMVDALDWCVEAAMDEWGGPTGFIGEYSAEAIPRARAALAALRALLPAPPTA